MTSDLHPARVAEWYREEPGDLQRATCDAVGEYIARRSVMVGLFDPGFEYPIRRGTGTCVSVGERRFVATAAHLFRDVPVPYRAALIPLTAAPSRDLFLPTGQNHRGGGGSDPVDVAWLELAEGTARDLGRDFLPLDGVEPHYSGMAGEPLFSYGFPETPAGPDGRPTFGDFPVQAYSTVVLDPATIDARFLPNAAIDIFARYSTRVVEGPLPDGRVARLPGAQGLSGSAFWRIDAGKHGIWTLDDVKFVGIQHQWCPEAEWFRATKVCHWLRLVADDHPELRPEIEAVLAR